MYGCRSVLEIVDESVVAERGSALWGRRADAVVVMMNGLMIIKKTIINE